MVILMLATLTMLTTLTALTMFTRVLRNDCRTGDIHGTCDQCQKQTIIVPSDGYSYYDPYKGWYRW
jgi:hypothetical protein